MLKNHWMLYLGIAICLLTLPSASAASLIKNGDFAVWKNGAPTNWTLAANKQNVVCDKNSGLANDGYSLCVNIDTEVGKVLGEIRQTVKVAPHQQLKLSGWLKSNKKGAALFMIKLRSKRKELKRITTSLSTSEWSQVERIFNTENADNIQILCRYKQHATFVGSKCWFGNVQLVPVSKDHKNSATSPSPLIKKDLGLKVYVSLEGAGEQNGKDWSNAMPATNGGLQRAYQQLGDSGSLFLGSGTYPGFTMQLRSGGKSVTQMKQIIGVDTGKGLPLFTSDFDKHKPETTGAVLFTALDGVCNWEIRNIQVKGYHSTLIMKGNHHNVTLANLVISESRDCLYLFGGATAEKPNNYSSNITIKDCTFKYYTKRAVRMLNGFNQIEIINCHADGGGKEWATERFAIGFQCYNKVEHVYNNNITFVDCTSQNHWDPNGDKYWNADGFAMERRNRNVRYIRCGAFGNTDGGWDDKSPNPTYIDCISIGNKRNYRLWSKRSLGVSQLRPMLINCVAAYAKLYGGTGSAAGMHVSDGNDILLVNCTLAYNPINIDIDNPYTVSEEASIELIDTVLVNTPGNTQVMADQNSQLSLSGVISYPALDKEKFIKMAGANSWTCDDVIISDDPEVVNGTANWRGKIRAFHSKRFPFRGYRGKPITKMNSSQSTKNVVGK